MVKRPIECSRDHSAFANLGRNYIWTVSFYKLVESARPIGIFLPSKQSICPLDGHASTPNEFWPCMKKVRMIAAQDPIDLPLGDDGGGVLALEDASSSDDKNGDASDENPSALDESLDSSSEPASSRDEMLGGDVSDASEFPDFSDNGSEGLGGDGDAIEPEVGIGLPHDDVGMPDIMGPPPQPLPPPARFDPALSEQSLGSRQHADIVLPYLGGTICYYSKTNRFEVRCGSTDHAATGRCRLSRIATASVSAANLAQGRPIGLAGAWLSIAADLATHSEHIHKAALQLCTHALRSHHRAQIEALPDAALLFAGESPQPEGEPAEPTRMP
jgi:hypothetical protein